MNVYGNVPDAPVNVIFGDAAFLHTAVVPLMVAVGKGLTVTTAIPVCSCEHAVELASRTLTRLYVIVPAVLVGTANVTLLPDVVVIV
jgi:hypothetical protein